MAAHINSNPEYRVWSTAKNRCFNPRNKSFAKYGGRGIRMCEEWRSDFDAFFNYMGPRPQGMSLDRFPDQNGDYRPGNCRWATIFEQNQNRRSARVYALNGEAHCLAEWARLLGVSVAALHYRLGTGMSFEAAVSKPIQKKEPWRHGLNRYQLGCRCQVCYDARRESNARYKRERLRKATALARETS